MTAYTASIWRLLSVPPTRNLLEWVTRSHAIIFMLHRFQDQETGVEGHDPAALDRLLTELRRRRYAFLDLEEMARSLIDANGSSARRLRRTVAFTMDDGYEDQARVGGDLFGSHDCPVTLFAVTEFLDGTRWMWWDKIRYIVEKSARDLSRQSLAHGRGDAAIHNGTLKGSLTRRLVAEVHALPEAERDPALQALAEQAQTLLPPKPPRRFSAMTWEQARELERTCMRFAPHTRTHPALDTVSDTRSREEISGSWNRMRAELSRPMPVLAYPYGRFQAKDERAARDAGLLAAVADRSGINHPSRIHRNPRSRFRIRRVGLPDDPARSALYASGLANVTDFLRSRGAVDTFA